VQQKVGFEAPKRPTKEMDQNITNNSSEEAPANMDAELTYSNTNSKSEALPCHEQYQGISDIEPESSTQPHDLLNQATKHIGVIESAFENISKVVSGLRSVQETFISTQNHEIKFTFH